MGIGLITSRAGQQTILVFTEESRLIVIPLADISSISDPNYPLQSRSDSAPRTPNGQHGNRRKTLKRKNLRDLQVYRTCLLSQRACRRACLLTGTVGRIIKIDIPFRLLLLVFLETIPSFLGGASSVPFER